MIVERVFDFRTFGKTKTPVSNFQSEYQVEKEKGPTSHAPR